MVKPALCERQPPERVRANVTLNIAGTKLDASFDVPTAKVTPRELLPIFRNFTEAIVGIAVDAAIGEGRKISCQAGCGACCRQLVPISVPEARQLADVVAAMPEDRRRDVLDRFTAATTRLKELGLLDRLKVPDQLGKSKQQAAIDYFRAGIACPFLVNESCSIYEERPLACREYLVTSDPCHCAALTPQKIDGIDLPSHASRSLMEVGGKTDGSPRWIALTLALDWVAEHPTDTPRPGPDLIRDFLYHLTEKAEAASSSPDDQPR